jgi:hypothetical protein
LIVGVAAASRFPWDEVESHAENINRQSFDFGPP